jgi:outer membrane protein assembly factor BamB
VIAYDPASGQEIWRAKCLSGDVAPSPVYADGVVYAVNAGSALAAIRADGCGDVSESHVLWTASEGLPDITSPLTDGKLLWLLSTGGTLTCYGAKDGKKLYEKDLETLFRSSPVLVGDRLYATSTEGVTFILAAEGTYRELGRCELGEEVDASAAFVDGRIYIRGKENLYCIGERQP